MSRKDMWQPEQPSSHTVAIRFLLMHDTHLVFASFHSTGAEPHLSDSLHQFALSPLALPLIRFPSASSSDRGGTGGVSAFRRRSVPFRKALRSGKHARTCRN